MSDKEILELIYRRENQMLIHSCIYYRLGTSLIDDFTFDKWARELRDLIQKYPSIAGETKWYKYFKDWDGTTGFHLPLHLPEIVGRSIKLLNFVEYCRKETIDK